MPGALAAPPQVRCRWKRSASLGRCEGDDPDPFHQTRGFKNHCLRQMYFWHYTSRSDNDEIDTLHKENNKLEFLWVAHQKDETPPKFR